MKRYTVGGIYYMKRDYKNLSENDRVEIVARRKIGKDTFVDVIDINNVVTLSVSVKKLRKRAR